MASPERGYDQQQEDPYYQQQQQQQQNYQQVNLPCISCETASCFIYHVSSIIYQLSAIIFHEQGGFLLPAAAAAAAELPAGKHLRFNFFITLEPGVE